MVLLSSWFATASPARAQESDSASGEAEAAPWSGWWWPASQQYGPTLFGRQGPLDKYDQYVSLLTGDDPHTRDWEQQQVFFPGTPWAGHCNGFAAAALLEPEPQTPVTALGVRFSVADLKGLLVDYHFGDSAAWSFGDSRAEVSPARFQRMLLEWLGDGATGFVATFDFGGGEVWSYPLYRFESEWTADDEEPDLWHVETTVWMADMNVSPTFVGVRPFPSERGLKLTYDLAGDPHKPYYGEWTGDSVSGRFGHPSRIWYPDGVVRNTNRDLVSPGLDRDTIASLLP
jgi:Transglutaminase elicitor